MNDNCMKASVHDGNRGSTEAHKGQLATSTSLALHFHCMHSCIALFTSIIIIKLIPWTPLVLPVTPGLLAM